MAQLEKDRIAFNGLYVEQEVFRQLTFPIGVAIQLKPHLIGSLFGSQLYLYSLNDITDEDLEGLCTVNNVKYVQSLRHEYLEDLRSISVNNTCSGTIDFLRSRSYLVSFRGYSVEQILEMGWAKIRKR